MRALLGITAALATACVLAASAVAATSTVSIVGCVYNHGGQVTVPAGSDVAFRLAWVTRNNGLTATFLRAATTTASVDGSPVANADSYWSAPAVDPSTGYSHTNWVYDTGITLGAGQSLTLTYDVVLSHPVTDGLQGRTPAGSIFGGPVTCTVTGA